MMIRDPFSWLVSKLFWHEIEKQHGIKCDNIEELRGWYKTFAMEFIVSICGEDCYVRWTYNILSLSDLMDQAEDNLRQSFAVIGLLNETENFYKMVSRRVYYMDTSRNMPQFRMKRHKSIRSPDFMFCKDLCLRSSFQRDVSLASPELRVMIHLCDVTVQIQFLCFACHFRLLSQYQKSSLFHCQLLLNSGLLDLGRRDTAFKNKNKTGDTISNGGSLRFM